MSHLKAALRVTLTQIVNILQKMDLRMLIRNMKITIIGIVSCLRELHIAVHQVKFLIRCNLGLRG
jgi:hypothetical protein